MRELLVIVWTMELLVAAVVPRHAAVAEHSEGENRNQSDHPPGGKHDRDDHYQQGQRQRPLKHHRCPAPGLVHSPEGRTQIPNDQGRKQLRRVTVV
jgi:hypothetical protein